VWIEPLFDGIATMFSVIVASGVFVVFAHLSRSLGLRKQGVLVQSWGGMPTTIFLRHRDETIDQYTTRRYHERLEKLVPSNWKAPTEEEEMSAPDDADAKYSAAVKWLISNTYDSIRFPLLFKENVGYGFRRNLLGLKPIGVFLAATCTIATFAAATGLIPPELASPQEFLAWSSVIVCISAVIFWVYLVTPQWIREAADRYAYQLLNTIDQISL
jgi:hypothetical protein